MDCTWDSVASLLNTSTLNAVRELCFTQMTPVQAACIPHFLKNKDVAVEAVTGSGKTLAFVIPIIEILLRRETPLKKHEVGAIILTPTRELAFQISEVVTHFLKHFSQFSALLIIGGSSPQQDIAKFVNNGGNILIATPGRLEDLFNRKQANFNMSASVKALEILVLDEADRLLEMGFEASINTVLGNLPKLRRTGLFSATQTDEVENLIRAGLRNPMRITVKEKKQATEADQRTPASLKNYYMIADADEKFSQLLRFLRDHYQEKLLLFFSTCACVDYFSRCLQAILKKMTVLAIHSKMKQKRNKVFETFRSMSSGLLVCTDVMARGVDIPDVQWVIQYDPPSSASAFVHRCGRTARIGNTGNALVMLLPAEDTYVEFIKINQKVPLSEMDKYSDAESAAERLKSLALKDRDFFEKGVRAFVSFIQSYSKHECNMIFRLKDLDYGKLATGFGLLRIPKMPELRGKTVGSFTPADVDFDAIPFKDKTREQQRVLKLQSAENKKSKPMARPPRSEAWSRKKEKKQKKQTRKEKKMMKSKNSCKEMPLKRSREEDGEDEWDELEKDIRLIKKLKKGKMLNPAKGIKEGVTRLCKTLVRSHITGINTSFRVLSILIPSKLDSGGTSNNLKRSTLFRTPVAWRNETSALKQGYSWCQLRLLFSVTRTTRMGAKESKARGGNVQGVNFAPREDTKPVYMSGCSTDTDSGNMASGVETVVCKVNDIGEGDAKEVQIGEHTALLVKENGNLYAVGNKCTHYGAPLSKGAYCNGVVRCPWHGACFNVKTGDIEDYPGLDSLPKFKVEVRSDEVVVTADPEDLKTSKRLKSMCRLDPRNKNTFVLVGGGAATATCAETLRQEGFTGRILVITKENNLPYDRPKLSKAMSSSAEAIALRKKEFYDEYGIEFTLGAEVTGVNTAKKKVTISDGSTISYNALLLATGGRPRTMTIPGQDLKNICVLRTPEDANYIAANSEGKNVVIIGSSFIGMEVTSCLAEKAKSVSVVDLIKVPFQLALGQQVGSVLQKMHEDKGVKFYFERGIKEFRGEDGHVTHAVLSDDTTLAADLCVLGIGVVPATDFLKDSSIKMTDRGFVTVDKYMKTNQSGVFAAGDIVEFPLFLNSNQQSNVQHWQMAHQHGRIAALNMLNKKVEIHSVPFFWTVMYGKSVRYTGYGHGYDDIVVHGDLSAPQFAAFYTKGDKVVAVASLAFDPIVSQAASLMEKGDTILKSEIQNDPKSWVGRLKQKL